MGTRQKIREAIKAELETLPGLKFVAIGRRHHLNEKKQLPAALIYTDNESQELITQRPLRFNHTLEVRVVYYVKSDGSTLGEDALDDLELSATPLIIDGLEALDDVKMALPTEWDLEGNGETDGDYLMGERLFLVEYETS